MSSLLIFRNEIKSQSIRNIFTILLSFSAILLLLSEREKLLELLRYADLSWVTAGLVCHFLNYMIRAQRIVHLCPNTSTNTIILTKITFSHGFLSYILPMRSGDFSLPLLLRGAGFPFAIGNLVFIRTRLLDIFGLGVLLIIATIVPNSIHHNKIEFLFFCIGLVLCTFPYIGVYLAQLPAFSNSQLFKMLFGDGKFPRFSLVEQAISVHIWFWTGCTSYCIIKAIGLPLSLPDAWLLATMQLPLQLLPIQGIANAGTHEAGWVMGLALFGIPSEQAITIAISTHLLILLYVLLLGGLSALIPENFSG